MALGIWPRQSPAPVQAANPWHCCGFLGTRGRRAEALHQAPPRLELARPGSQARVQPVKWEWKWDLPCAAGGPWGLQADASPRSALKSSAATRSSSVLMACMGPASGRPRRIKVLS